jgi:hypothetical protein
VFHGYAHGAELAPGFGAPFPGMGFYGWYGEARASTPPGVYQYDVVTIETTLWDMQPERVIWAGTGEAVDPEMSPLWPVSWPKC